MPIKVNELGKKQKGKKFYLKKNEDKEMLEIEDLKPKKINQIFDENNYTSNQYLKKNDIMIKDTMNYSFYIVFHIIEINILFSHKN